MTFGDSLFFAVGTVLGIPVPSSIPHLCPLEPFTPADSQRCLQISASGLGVGKRGARVALGTGGRWSPQGGGRIGVIPPRCGSGRSAMTPRATLSPRICRASGGVVSHEGTPPKQDAPLCRAIRGCHPPRWAPLCRAIRGCPGPCPARCPSTPGAPGAPKCAPRPTPPCPAGW